MIICLFLDNNDIRGHLSTSEILLFDKGCCLYTCTVPKDKYKNIQETVSKCQPSSNKEPL